MFSETRGQNQQKLTNNFRQKVLVSAGDLLSEICLNQENPENQERQENRKNKENQENQAKTENHENQETAGKP